MVNGRKKTIKSIYFIAWNRLEVCIVQLCVIPMSACLMFEYDVGDIEDEFLTPYSYTLLRLL